MFEFLFGYPFAIYQQADWAFESVWPMEFLYSLLFICGLLITAFIFRAKSSLSVFRLVGIGSLQWLLIALVLVMIWQPVLVIERLKPNQNSVAMMLDTSKSMAYGSEQGVRIDIARGVFASDPLQDIRETYSREQYLFSENTTLVEDISVLPEPGTETKIGDSLLQVLERAKTKSLAALILVSDGAESGSALTPEQLAEIAAYGVPVHSIGIGREEITEDIELERIVVPDRVLPNTLVAAEASIRHDGPGQARLKVYNGNEFLAARDLELGEASGSTSVRIEFDLGESGFKELSFQLDPIEGERNIENNRRSHMVEVADQNYSVLYVEGEPRWEYKYIRRALTDDPTMDLMTLLWVSNNKFYRQGINDPSQLESGFPDNKEDLYAFDAVVIGSLDAPRLSAEQQQLIYDFVNERGGSLLMLGGRKGLAEGNWGNTPVGEILPVRLKDIEQSFVKERAQAVLTPQGADVAFLTFDEGTETNADRWQQLPPLDNFQKLGTLRPAAATLLGVRAVSDAGLESKTLPLLVSQPYGNGQSFVFATGGTWRWQMSLPSEDDSHHTFWRQLMRALVVNSPERMSFSVEPDGEDWKLVAEVRDELYQPLDDARVVAVVSAEINADSNANSSVNNDPAAGGIELSASPDLAGRYEARMQAGTTGTYFIDAIASRGGEPLEAARVAIHRSNTESESFGIRQDRAQLERISAATGGRYWTPDSIDDLPNAIASSSAGIVEQIRYPLWGIPILFLVLIAIKVVEWLLRRRWGHI